MCTYLYTYVLVYIHTGLYYRIIWVSQSAILFRIPYIMNEPIRIQWNVMNKGPLLHCSEVLTALVSAAFGATFNSMAWFGIVTWRD